MLFSDCANANLERLRSNSYTGRGIILGMSADSQKMVQVYWLTGRSENSRNRVFAVESDGIRTQAYDASKLIDPRLIIYWPVRRFRDAHIVSNGDQTDTIHSYLKKGMSFEDALMTRSYEPDAPNFTPRISGMMDISDKQGAYTLSILKAEGEEPVGCIHCFYRFDRALPGYGHCLHTYSGDGKPLPSFKGEPYPVPLGKNAKETAELYWDTLNHENRVALLALGIDRTTGEVETFIINRHGNAK